MISFVIFPIEGKVIETSVCLLRLALAHTQICKMFQINKGLT